MLTLTINVYVWVHLGTEVCLLGEAFLLSPCDLLTTSLVSSLLRPVGLGLQGRLGVFTIVTILYPQLHTEAYRLHSSCEYIICRLHSSCMYTVCRLHTWYVYIACRLHSSCMDITYRLYSSFMYIISFTPHNSPIHYREDSSSHFNDKKIETKRLRWPSVLIAERGL